MDPRSQETARSSAGAVPSQEQLVTLVNQQMDDLNQQNDPIATEIACCGLQVVQAALRGDPAAFQKAATWQSSVETYYDTCDDSERAPRSSSLATPPFRGILLPNNSNAPKHLGVYNAVSAVPGNHGYVHDPNTYKSTYEARDAYVRATSSRSSHTQRHGLKSNTQPLNRQSTHEKAAQNTPSWEKPSAGSSGAPIPSTTTYKKPWTSKAGPIDRSSSTFPSSVESDYNSDSSVYTMSKISAAAATETVSLVEDIRKRACYRCSLDTQHPEDGVEISLAGLEDLNSHTLSLIVKELDWPAIKSLMLTSKTMFDALRELIIYVKLPLNHATEGNSELLPNSIDPATFSTLPLNNMEFTSRERMQEWVKPQTLVRAPLDSGWQGRHHTEGFESPAFWMKPITTLVFDYDIHPADREVAIDPLVFAATWVTILQFRAVSVIELRNSLHISPELLELTRLKDFKSLEILRIRNCPLMNPDALQLLDAASGTICGLLKSRDLTFDVDFDIIAPSEHLHFYDEGFANTRLALAQKLVPLLIRLKSQPTSSPSDDCNTKRTDHQTCYPKILDALQSQTNATESPSTWSEYPPHPFVVALTTMGQGMRNTAQEIFNLKPMYFSQYRGADVWQRHENVIIKMARQCSQMKSQKDVPQEKFEKAVWKYCDTVLRYRHWIATERLGQLIIMERTADELHAEGLHGRENHLRRTMSMFLDEDKQSQRKTTEHLRHLRCDSWIEPINDHHFQAVMKVFLNPNNPDSWPPMDSIFILHMEPMKHVRGITMAIDVRAADPFLEIAQTYVQKLSPKSCSHDQARKLIRCYRCNFLLSGVGFSKKAAKAASQDEDDPDGVCRACRDSDLWEDLESKDQYLKDCKQFFASPDRMVQQVFKQWEADHPGTNMMLPTVADLEASSTACQSEHQSDRGDDDSDAASETSFERDMRRTDRSSAPHDEERILKLVAPLQDTMPIEYLAKTIIYQNSFLAKDPNTNWPRWLPTPNADQSYSSALTLLDRSVAAERKELVLYSRRAARSV